MVTSTRGVWAVVAQFFERSFDEAVVYADRAGEVVLHEGDVRVLPNGCGAPDGSIALPGHCP